MWGRFKEWLAWRDAERKGQSLRSFAIGVNSTVDVTADTHIVMLDYDIADIEAVIASVKEVQEFWHLSDISIYRTKHGFHAIGWYDHVPYSRLGMIINFAARVDPMFKYISRFHDHKTLRAAGKHEPLCSIKPVGDIHMERVIPGPRKPTTQEVELGEIKRREHSCLRGSERMEL